MNTENTAAGLPGIFRRNFERAIREAEAPQGMSTHDGMARVNASQLRYLLAVLDGQQPAALELERMRGVAESLRAAGLMALHALSVSTVSPRGEALRQAAREALRPAIDAANGAAWLSAQQPAASETVTWGPPPTVGMLIRQLQTMDADMPVNGAFHTDYHGERRAFVRPLSMSRERVNGRFIETGNQAVPLSLVIWSAQDERQPAASGEPAQPDPTVMQYLSLTDAMRYEAGPQLLSAEEYAAALYNDAARYRWLRDEAFNFGRDDGHPTPWVTLGTRAEDASPITGASVDMEVDIARAAQAREAQGGATGGASHG